MKLNFREKLFLSNTIHMTDTKWFLETLQIDLAITRSLGNFLN
jgi:hypothetical protein